MPENFIIALTLGICIQVGSKIIMMIIEPKLKKWLHNHEIKKTIKNIKQCILQIQLETYRPRLFFYPYMKFILC